MTSATARPDQPNPQPALATAREAATREILSAISQSRDDEKPVFDIILQNAGRLCEVPFAGLYLVDEARSHVSLVASIGTRSEYLERALTRWSLDDDASAPRSIVERRVVHIEDLVDTEGYRRGDRQRVDAVQIEGVRTFVSVPLIQGDSAIGCIGLYRREVAPFSAEHIALLETFAAQAVIAIENVRQFCELQSRLEREAATREILQVISQSRDDESPVFDVITQNALHLSGSWDASLMVVSDDGDTLVTVAAHGWDESIRAYMDENPPKLTDPSSTYAQVVATREPVTIVDIKNTDRYREGQTGRRLAVDKLGLNTMLHVPLINEERCVGVISVYRREIRAYSADEIALLQTFAAQAVIAIENVQQFKALAARNEEVLALNASLKVRVDEQVGEIERMGRLKRFLSPAVAEAVVNEGEAMLSSHRALIATLFCDIRGFTAFCETAEPEETIEVLQTYHEAMGMLIAAHGGGVDKRMGDGIMVILNDPLPCEDPAGDAVRLAVAMRARMQELCKGWKRLGHRLGFGVGISLGYATVGMVGAEGRYDYTASGTAVNLAARLCDQAEDGEILLSPRARMAVEDDVATEPIGEIDFKGLRAPVEVFRLRD